MTEQDRNLDGVGVFILIVLCAVWGLNHTVIKWSYTDISPILSATVRSILAVGLLAVYCRVKSEPLKSSLHWGHGAFLGAVFTVEFVFLYTGINLTLASRGAVLLYTQPFFTAFLAHLFIPTDRLTPGRLAGMAVAFMGVAVVLLGRPETGRASLLGDIFCVAGGLCWAILNVYTRRVLIGRATAHQVLYWQMAWSIPGLALATFLLEEPFIAWTAKTAVSMGYQVVVVAFISYLAWLSLFKKYKVSSLGSASFMTPVFGVGLAALVMGDPITMSLVVGAGAVSVGVWLVNRG